MSDRPSDPLRDLLFLGLAAPLAVLGVLALTGVGLLRGGGPQLVFAIGVMVVVLPPYGLAALVGPRARSAVFGLLLGAWSLGALVCVPLYFPGERAKALETGLAQLGAVTGLDVPVGLGGAFDGWLPGVEDGRDEGVLKVEPPAPAAPEAPPPPPALDPSKVVTPAETEGVVLPYEGSGRSLVVPVVLEADGEEVEVSMLFDTGASFTSVDEATLRALGVRVPRDAPEVVVRTAGGERTTKLVLLDRVWLGGFAVEGVTVGVCDACAHGDEVGLLGLNVSRRFLVTVDQEARELRLEPRPGADRTADVRYWAEPSASAKVFPDGRVDVTVSLENNGPRAISDAVVRIGCDDGYEVPIPEVGPDDEAHATVSLREGADCEGYTVELVRASW